MKNIQVVKENREHKIFSVKSYSFIEEDSEFPAIPIYHMIVKKNCTSPLDVRLWLEEVNSSIQFLLEFPAELTEYIKQYEESKPFNETCLFHDLRTRYFDIIVYDDENLKNNVILVGYTFVDEEIYLAIKAFSLTGLVAFSRKIIDYCGSNEITLDCKNDVRWIQLEQCILPEVNAERSDIFNIFLKKTLQYDYCKTFLEAFKIIDFQGYLDKKFFDKALVINDRECKVNDINQFTKYFSPFWKTDISVKKISRTVLYLHDELLNDESINKIVYTIKPHLMQYYQLHWFEDFCSNIIKKLDIPEFEIVSIYSGRRFNFFQNGNIDDAREIDVVIGIQHNGMYKIVAIECKKTLSNYEIKATNKKIKAKILKSHSNIIDAFIHIGCFNNDVNFDKTIDETDEMYKQGLIQLTDDPKAVDAPYYAFSISSIENLQLKMSYVIKEIFEQW